MTTRRTSNRTGRRTVSRGRRPTFWRQHLVTGSVTAGGQSPLDLTPVDVEDYRPVTLRRMIGNIHLSTGFTDELGYVGFTIAGLDAVSSTSLPDPSGDPSHPWYYWTAMQLSEPNVTREKEFDIRTSRIVKPNFRFMFIIDGDSSNSGALSFDVSLRLLWQL